MKKNFWEVVIRIAIAALTAALTALGTTSCMGFAHSNPHAERQVLSSRRAAEYTEFGAEDMYYKRVKKKRMCNVSHPLFVLLNDLESYPERVFVFVPIGAERFETAYLGGGADVLTYAGADVVVADAHQSDGV